MTESSSLPRNIAETIYAQGKQHGNRVALIHPEEGWQLSFDEFLNKVDQFRSGLRENKYQPSDRILLLMPLSLNLLSLIVAIYAEGIIPVLLDPRLSKNSIMRAIRLSHCQSIVSVQALFRWRFIYWFLWLKDLYSVDTFSVGVRPLSDLLGSTKRHPCIAVQDQDTVMIALTSGTTGKPKVIARNHRILFHQQIFCHQYLPEVKTDVHLAGYPVSILQSLTDGATTIFPDLQSDSNNIDNIVKYQVTRLSGPPGFLDRLATYLMEKKQTLPQVKNILLGGAPIPRWLCERLQQVFPQAKLSLVYGCSECEPIGSGDGRAYVESQHDGYLIGQVLSELTVLQLPTGLPLFPGIFRLGLKGANVYTENQDFHDTGDLLEMDSDGNLWFMGRATDLIHSDQGQIPAGIIESRLEQIPCLRRAAVVQKDDQTLVFIEVFKGVDWPPASQQLAEKILRDFHLTKTVFRIVSDIPVDARHQWKVQKGVLKNI